MKKLLFSIIAFLTVSCLTKNTYYVQSNEFIPLSEVSIPDTAKNLEYTHIGARAEQSNGCWSNLHFILSKRADFEYSLAAFGTYESYGSCADVMVYADTIIDFKPTETGIYKFYITKKPYNNIIDTMIVE
jgi:hypothetical protein